MEYVCRCCGMVDPMGLEVVDGLCLPCEEGLPPPPVPRETDV